MFAIYVDQEWTSIRNLSSHTFLSSLHHMLSCWFLLQLAPKPVQTQASSGAQQPRLIVPALPSSLPQMSGTGATGNIQFPHGVISGGVVYLPQVSDVGNKARIMLGIIIPVWRCAQSFV